MRKLISSKALGILAMALPAFALPMTAKADPIVLQAPPQAIAAPVNPLAQPQMMDDRILVLPFQPVDPAESRPWIGKSIEESLTADLISMAPARVVHGNQFAATLDAAMALGKENHCRYVIAGGFVTADHLLRVTGQILDVNAGQAVAGLKVTGDPTRIFAMEDGLSAQVKDALFPTPSAQQQQPPPIQGAGSDDASAPATYYSPYATAPAAPAYGADPNSYVYSPPVSSYDPYAYDPYAYGYGYPYAGYGYGGFGYYPFAFGLGFGYYGGYGYGHYGHGYYNRGGYGGGYHNNGYGNSGGRNYGNFNVSGGNRSAAIVRGGSAGYSGAYRSSYAAPNRSSFGTASAARSFGSGGIHSFSSSGFHGGGGFSGGHSSGSGGHGGGGGHR